MHKGLRRLILSRPTRSVVLLFTVTILVPACVLTALSVRVLEQDRELAVRRLEQKVETASRRLAEAIDREFGGAEAVLRRAAGAGHVTPGELPNWIREAASVPGRLAISIPNRTVWPEYGLAYLPWSPDPSVGDGDPRSRTTRLNSRAQHIRLSHRVEAHQLFQELATVGRGERIASVPADLVGQYGACATELGPRQITCAVGLYTALARGDWLLEKPRYVFYIAEVRKWISTNQQPETVSAAEQLDRRRRELAEALISEAESSSTGVLRIQVQAAPSRSDSGLPADTAEPLVLAVRREWIQGEWWPSMVARVDRDITASLLDEDVARAPSDHARVEEGARVTRHALGDHHWRIAVSSADIDAAVSAAGRDRSINVALLACALLLLGTGMYFTGRVVRRELKIASIQSDFVSAVSHEFRSPLTGIRQLSELLVRDRVPSDERRHEYYVRISEESARLSRIVDNILDFSRMENGRKDLRKELIDTSTWLLGLTDAYRQRLGDRGERLVLDLPPLAAVRGDVQSLTTAVDNLVDNAVKYSPNGSPIRIIAAQRASGVAITVQDFGVGIAQEDRPHIFERFYRGSSQSTTVVRGTGIGLSLVHHIVRAHHGHVEVVSETGQGSSFTIVLPAATTEEGRA